MACRWFDDWPARVCLFCIRVNLIRSLVIVTAVRGAPGGYSVLVAILPSWCIRTLQIRRATGIRDADIHTLVDKIATGSEFQKVDRWLPAISAR